MRTTGARPGPRGKVGRVARTKPSLTGRGPPAEAENAHNSSSCPPHVTTGRTSCTGRGFGPGRKREARPDPFVGRWARPDVSRLYRAHRKGAPLDAPRKRGGH